MSQLSNRKRTMNATGRSTGMITWAWALIAASLFAVSMFFMLQPGF